MSKVTDLLDKAKAAIKSAETEGNPHLQDAAELIVQALEAGATQERVSKWLGKSQPWVSQLLMWRKNGYVGGAFTRSHKSRFISRANKPKPKGQTKRRTRKAATPPDDSDEVTEREFEVRDDEPEEFDTKSAKANPQNWMTGILLRADQSLQMCRDLEFLVAGAVKVAKDKTATRSEIAIACRAVATAWGIQAQKVEDQNGEADREPQKASVL